jgi:hypothetical protein
MAGTITLNTPPNRTGVLDLTAGAACTAAGDSVDNTNGTTFVIFFNALAGNLTVTMVYGPSGTVDGSVLPAKTGVIAAGKIAIFGPFTTLYNDVNTLLNFTYSPTPTGCKVYAFKAS